MFLLFAFSCMDYTLSTPRDEWEPVEDTAYLDQPVVETDEEEDNQGWPSQAVNVGPNGGGDDDDVEQTDRLAGKCAGLTNCEDPQQQDAGGQQLPVGDEEHQRHSM